MSYADKRETMVARQIVARGVSDERVLAAMRSVPRHEYVPEGMREFAYEDSALPIEEAQTISQPYIVALMAAALQLEPGDRVLEIGAGSGYAAAVLSRIAAEVYAIERHEILAKLAAERATRFQYDNLHVKHGDGTLGWPEHAPFDAIAVAAGGPEVPQSLLEQLAVGGRLVIPVGTEHRAQELLRIVRIDEHKFERESLLQVSFVPLIGAEGWSADGTPVPPHRAPGPLRTKPSVRHTLSKMIAHHCQPFEGIEQCYLAPLLERVGDSQLVLIGEASHGTSEFYRLRAYITRELITRAGFNLVAIEGDWPDVSTLDSQVRGLDIHDLPVPAFSRFPTWMWLNRETKDFVHWLAQYNEGRASPESKCSLHGLDLYSLSNSIAAVLDYLDRVDPVAAESARVRYGCFSPWERDPAVYGRAAVSGRMPDCEDEVVETLTNLLKKRLPYATQDGDSFFNAEQNATVVRNAERYYRTMYYGSRDSWNLRDRHMFETLQRVLAHRGPQSRVVVWAHNSHVGFAPATEMGSRGEFNIGQLVREQYGHAAYLIGFGTDRGTVAAASNWDEPVQFMAVRPSHADSYERVCHETAVSQFLLPLRDTSAELREALMAPRLERAIGVVYRPETEMLSHYFEAVLPAQFDEYIWFDETRAVEPLDVLSTSGIPETYPFGL